MLEGEEGGDLGGQACCTVDVPVWIGRVYGERLPGSKKHPKGSGLGAKPSLPLVRHRGFRPNLRKGILKGQQGDQSQGRRTRGREQKSSVQRPRPELPKASHAAEGRDTRWAQPQGEAAEMEPKPDGTR